MKCRHQYLRATAAAFTLIELLVVMAIVVIPGGHRGAGGTGAYSKGNGQKEAVNQIRACDHRRGARPSPWRSIGRRAWFSLRRRRNMRGLARAWRADGHATDR